MRAFEMNSSGLTQKIPSCDHGNKSSGSVKRVNFLTILDTTGLSKKMDGI